MGTVPTTVLIQGKTVGLNRAQAEINALYRRSTQNVERLSMGVQKFGHHSLATFQIFKGLAIYRGFGMITQQLAEGVEKAIDFEREMANVNSLLQVTSEEIQDLGDYAAELSRAIPLSMQAIAGGMYDIASAGFTAETQIKEIARLAGEAAVAGVTDLKNSVQAGIGTMNAFGKSVDDLEHIYDVHFMTVKMGILTYEQLNQVMGRVSATASLAGQAMETANAALVAISRGGFGGVAFAEGSTRVVRFFQELSDPAAQQDIQALGVAVFDSFGKMRGAIDIVAELQVKLADMTEEARQATIRQIFTNIRSAQGFQVLSEQIDVWREAQMKAIFSAGAMESAFAKQTDTIAATMTQLTNKFTSAMRDLVTFITPAIEKLTHIFDALGENMLTIVAITGIFVGRLMAVSIITKQLVHQEQLRIVTQQGLEAMHTISNATLQRQELLKQRALAQGVAINRQMGIASMLKSTEGKIDDKLLLKKQQLLAQSEVFIDTKAAEIATRQATIDIAKVDINLAVIERQQLMFRSTALKYNILAMSGMVTGMLLMTQAAQDENEWMRVAGGAIMGASIAIQTYTALVPMFLQMQSAKILALGTEATKWWEVAAAQAAATGGTSAILAAAGVAAVIGIVTAATMALGTATHDTTNELEDFEDVATRLDNAGEDLTGTIRGLTQEMIEQGKSIGYITQQMQEYYKAAATVGDIGPGFLRGLATQRFAMIGETAIVSPEIARTEKGKVTPRAYAALGSLGFSEEEVRRRGRTLEFIDEVQSKLLEYVTSADEWKRAIGEAFALDIFPEGFGESLITLWEDYGQKLEIVKGEHAEVFEGAMDYISKLRESIKQEFIIKAETEVEPYDIKATPYTGTWPGSEGMHIEKILLSEEQLQAKREKWAEEELRTSNDAMAKEYRLLQTVSDHWMSIGSIAGDAINAIPKTMSDLAISIQENISEATSQFGKMMDIDDMIESIVGAGNQLDAAGFYFGGVAGNWDDLGKQWAAIQRTWMGIQMIQTLIDVLGAMEDIPDVVTGTVAQYTSQLTENAVKAQELIDKGTYDYAKTVMANMETAEPGSPWYYMSDQIYNQMQKVVGFVDSYLGQTEQVFTGWLEETRSFWDTSELSSIGEIQEQLFGSLLPILEDMFGTAGGGFIDIIKNIMGGLGDPSFWDIILGDAEEEVVQTIAEMAAEFLKTINGASGFSGAIDAFVEHSSHLESAGYYWRDVAGNWAVLGQEWAKIQATFKVTEMINSFVQAADMMTEYGVELPATFQTSMFSLMQQMAGGVLPNFQSVIDELLDNIGNEDFWSALADGIAQADIIQQNSITLAPYIVISERADAEEVTQLVHDSMVAEAKRAGFTWGG